MTGTIQFDREIDPNKHYISPGGYEARFNNGKSLEFDFMDYSGRVHGDCLDFEVENPDIECFEDIPKFKASDFKKHLDWFEEFYIYTGEYNDPEINPVAVKNLTLEFKEKDKIIFVDIPKDKLPTFEEVKQNEANRNDNEQDLEM